MSVLSLGPSPRPQVRATPFPSPCDSVPKSMRLHPQAHGHRPQVLATPPPSPCDLVPNPVRDSSKVCARSTQSACEFNQNTVRFGIQACATRLKCAPYGICGRSAALFADLGPKGWEADVGRWAGRVSREYRMILLEEPEKLRPRPDPRVCGGCWAGVRRSPPGG